jgi:hypothetical protein
VRLLRDDLKRRNASKTYCKELLRSKKRYRF